MSLYFLNSFIFANNANAHVLPDVWLGSGISHDFDGLLIDGYLMSGKEDNGAKVLVTGEMGGGSYLNVWINFDQDSQFNDSNELILKDAYITPITPVIIEDESVEDAFAAIYKFQIPIQESVLPGLYSLRLELNTLPQGQGEVVDFAQITVPILDQEYADIANGVIDFSRARPNSLGYTSWEPESTLSSLFSSIYNFFTGKSSISNLDDPLPNQTPQAQMQPQPLVAQIQPQPQVAAHQAQDARVGKVTTDWEIAFYFFCFGGVVAFCIFMIWNHYNNKRIHKEFDARAIDIADSNLPPVTEEEGFGIYHRN